MKNFRLCLFLDVGMKEYKFGAYLYGAKWRRGMNGRWRV